MANPIIKIHNAETGEEIEREMTKEELVQYEKDLAKQNDLIIQEKNQIQAKNALLEKLGITAEEAKLLLS